MPILRRKVVCAARTGQAVAELGVRGNPHGSQRGDHRGGTRHPSARHRGWLAATCTVHRPRRVTETWWRKEEYHSLGGLQGEDRTLPGSRGGEGVADVSARDRGCFASVTHTITHISRTLRALYADVTRDSRRVIRTLRAHYATLRAHYAHVSRDSRRVIRTLRAHYAHISRTFRAVILCHSTAAHRDP